MPRPPGYLVPPPLSRDAIRRLDAAAIEEHGVPGLVLMENAGEGCVRLIEALSGRDSTRVAPPFHVVSGFGNNAGDGFVIARHLFNRGVPVEVHLTAPASRIRPGSDAGVNLDAARRTGVPLREPGEDLRADIRRATTSGTIVDAIFGSGLSRPVESPQREWIDSINDSGLGVLAIDIPSGLDADSGKVLGAAIRADHTFTFVAPKLGFSRDAGPALCGEVHVVGISIPRPLLERCAAPPESPPPGDRA